MQFQPRGAGGAFGKGGLDDQITGRGGRAGGGDPRGFVGLKRVLNRGGVGVRARRRGSEDFRIAPGEGPAGGGGAGEGDIAGGETLRGEGDRRDKQRDERG